jgi:hypothetical protein
MPNTRRFLSAQDSVQIPPDTSPQSQCQLPARANQRRCLPAHLKKTKVDIPGSYCLSRTTRARWWLPTSLLKITHCQCLQFSRRGQKAQKTKLTQRSVIDSSACVSRMWQSHYFRRNLPAKTRCLWLMERLMRNKKILHPWEKSISLFPGVLPQPCIGDVTSLNITRQIYHPSGLPVELVPAKSAGLLQPPPWWLIPLCSNAIHAEPCTLC